MRLFISSRLVALALIALPLAGCLERGQPPLVATGGDNDDAFCRANNVAVGSGEYVACRKNRDVQRGNATARADRAQRNLGEMMLNNPNQAVDKASRNLIMFNLTRFRVLFRLEPRNDGCFA